MNLLRILSAILLLYAGSVLGMDHYTIDSEKTIPTFEITPLGMTAITGRFNKSAGYVSFDFKARTGQVVFDVYADSLDIGWLQDWSQYFKDEDLLNAKNFPIMTFQSDRLVFSGKKVVGAQGQFTMLGITKPITIQVADFKCGVIGEERRLGCIGEVSAVIKRSDYGLSKYIPIFGDEVKIQFPVEGFL